MIWSSPMRKLLVILALIPTICLGQLNLKQTFKFATFYTAMNGGTSIADIETYSNKGNKWLLN